MASLDWLVGGTATNAFGSLMAESLDTHKIFSVSQDGYRLVDRDGNVLQQPVWKVKPSVQSYLFFVGNVDGQHHIYTLLGEEVTGCEGIEVVTILHFWVVYKFRGSLCLSKLIQEGTGFRLGDKILIGSYGYLGQDEVVLWHNDCWKQFMYTDSLKYIRTIDWLPNIAHEQVMPMMEKGFSYSFIKSNYDHLGKPCRFTPQDEAKAYAIANEKEKTIFKKLTELANLYTSSDITSALGLSPTIMYVLEYYRRLKDVAEL